MHCGVQQLQKQNIDEEFKSHTHTRKHYDANRQPPISLSLFSLFSVKCVINQRLTRQKGTEGLNGNYASKNKGKVVISTPRGRPRDHGRGLPCPSHIRRWMEFEGDRSRNQGDKVIAKHWRRGLRVRKNQGKLISRTIYSRQTGCK